MNLKTVFLFPLLIAFACSAAEAQTSANQAGIYIQQSPDDGIGLPVNRAGFNEALVFERNEVRTISLFYSDQFDLLSSDTPEDFQWGSDDFIAETEAGFTIPVDTESDANSSEEAAVRMAELLSNMITNRGEARDSSDMAKDNDAMEAFRNAFKAVIEEEASAEENTETPPVSYSDVDGIVLDETRSKTGRDFYNAFYDAWSKLEGKENSVVRIAEKPGPGMGSIVFVEVDYEEIFELRLRPGDQRTKQAGDVAATRTLSYLKEKPNKPLIY